jgi:hypothetical protein
VALDQASAGDRFFRKLFHGKVKETAEHPETMLYGYLTVPRRAAPRWYHEGIAVFLETWMAGGLGRAQGPYDEMVFRSMVRDSTRINDALGLESEGTKIDFQVGVNSYLYGTRFFCYLAHRYSPESLIRWVSRPDGSRRYFASQFRRVYGVPLDEAWREWIAWEHGFQQENLDSIRRYPTTAYRDLSPHALGSVSRACVDAKRTTLWVGADYPGKVAHIAAISLIDGSLRGLRDVKGPALYFVCSLVGDPDTGTLFYTTHNNEWRDLWSLDTVTGDAHRLMSDVRVGDLAFNRTDRSLWGVRHFNGISTVVRLEPPYTDYRQVCSLPYGRDLYDLDISPDGTTLCASAAEISGRQTLRSMKTEAMLQGDTTSTVLFDFGNSLPSNFVFSPDGQYLFGSSYYTGVSNIFRYDLGRDSMELVTNCETGFFRPMPLGGDSLIVFRYSGQGFVPALIHAQPLQDASAITFLGQQLVEEYPILREWMAPPPSSVGLDSLAARESDYRAIRLVRLGAIYPVIEGYKDELALGLRVNASDPLSMHAFDLSATGTVDSRLPADERWHVTMGYKRYNFIGRLRYNAASFYDLFGPTKTSRKGYGLSLGYNKALIHDLPRSMELDLNLSGYTGLERLPDYQNVPTPAGFDQLVSGCVQFTDKNMRASIGAADYEKGWQWKLSAVHNTVRFYRRRGHVVWKGFPQAVATLDAGLPLPIRNSSLWLRNAVGYSPGDPAEPFANFYFGGFGNNYIDHQDPKRYRDYESFPGTEINAIGGTNFARSMLEWTLPALRFRRAGTLAFYATWARLAFFLTGLVTNVDSAFDRRQLANAGLQVDLRLALLTQYPLTLSLGFARAAERHQPARTEWMVSLKIL